MQIHSWFIAIFHLDRYNTTNKHPWAKNSSTGSMPVSNPTSNKRCTVAAWLHVAAWLSGSSWSRSMKLPYARWRQARLVLGWVTIYGWVNNLGLWPATQANSAFDLQRDRKWVKAGMVHSTTTTTVLRPFSGNTQVSRCHKRTYGLHGARQD